MTTDDGNPAEDSQVLPEPDQPQSDNVDWSELVDLNGPSWESEFLFPETEELPRYGPTEREMLDLIRSRRPRDQQD